MSIQKNDGAQQQLKTRAFAKQIAVFSSAFQFVQFCESHEDLSLEDIRTILQQGEICANDLHEFVMLAQVVVEELDDLDWCRRLLARAQKDAVDGTDYAVIADAVEECLHDLPLLTQLVQAGLKCCTGSLDVIHLAEVLASRNGLNDQVQAEILLKKALVDCDDCLEKIPLAMAFADQQGFADRAQGRAVLESIFVNDCSLAEKLEAIEVLFDKQFCDDSVAGLRYLQAFYHSLCQIASASDISEQYFDDGEGLIELFYQTAHLAWKQAGDAELALTIANHGVQVSQVADESLIKLCVFICTDEFLGNKTAGKKAFDHALLLLAEMEGADDDGELLMDEDESEISEYGEDDFDGDDNSWEKLELMSFYCTISGYIASLEGLNDPTWAREILLKLIGSELNDDLQAHAGEHASLGDSLWDCPEWIELAVCFGVDSPLFNGQLAVKLFAMAEKEAHFFDDYISIAANMNATIIDDKSQKIAGLLAQARSMAVDEQEVLIVEAWQESLLGDLS